MANEALFVQGGSYDAAELRKLIAGIWSAPTPGGVISGMEVSAGAGTAVNVSAGFAVVNDGSGGAYFGVLSSTTSVSLTAFSGTNRTDRIYARVMDPGSGATAGEIEITKAQGTTTIPALSVPLADVTVTSTGLTISSAPRVLATTLARASVSDTATTASGLIIPGSTTSLAFGSSSLGNQPSRLWGHESSMALRSYPVADVRVGFSDNATTALNALKLGGFLASEYSRTSHTHSVSGSSVAYATNAAAAYTLRQSGSPTGTQMYFNWSGQTSQPSWLWGSNDGVNHYVWNPSNFSVNYASNAGALSGLGYGSFIRKDVDDTVGSQTVYTNQFPFFFTGIGASPTYTLGLNSNRQVMLAAASSRRYKKEIADFEVSIEALRALRPRQFKYDGAVDEVYEDSELLGGFIAEEVAEAVPMAANYISGKPEDFDDRTLLAGAYKLIGDLYERIEALEGRLAALEQG